MPIDRSLSRQARRTFASGATVVNAGRPLRSFRSGYHQLG
jgi:hypothetical protein